jgi:hypothetical protein
MDHFTGHFLLNHTPADFPQLTNQPEQRPKDQAEINPSEVRPPGLEPGTN